jgi:hypothetical protein
MILLFEPIDQETRGGFVIGSGEAAAVVPIRGRVVERQVGPTHADAIYRSMKSSLQRFAGLVQRELDAR